MKSRLHGVVLAAVAANAALVVNAANIAIDSVQQRWPWNNKVDITYTVTDGQNHAAGVYCGIEFNVSVPGYGDILVHGYSLGASAKGVWTVTLTFANNTPQPRTAYIEIPASGFTLIVK